MIEHSLDYPAVILTVGLIVVLTMFTKSCLERIGLPALVGFLLVGIAIRAAGSHWQLLAPGTGEILGFLSKVGLITLLFRVGLESDLTGLLRQLRSASLVWLGDVALTILIGFSAAAYLLGLHWITALIVGTALTATSVGISVAIWDDANALQSPNGELLLDVAELDDVSAIVLMAVLFAVLPQLKAGPAEGGDLPAVIAGTAAVFLAKLAGFGFFCLLFSKFAEQPITSYFRNLDPPPDFILVVISIGFVIAALADLAGFSTAIGAFFAGIVFSRDPMAVKREGSFIPLHEFFSPFFFIGIGLGVDPSTLGSAVELGIVLVGVALATKMIADGLPVWLLRGGESAVLIGVSMMPRAEIAMVIMGRGTSLGDWAVPAEVFSAMVLVSIATCIISPITVRGLLKKWPQEGEEK